MGQLYKDEYNIINIYNGEFDPGSGRTLAACLTHASLGQQCTGARVSNAWVIYLYHRHNIEKSVLISDEAIYRQSLGGYR